MHSKLPSTPAEVLDISTPELISAIENTINTAKESGDWITPYKEAATSLEDMTLVDMGYWIHKCTNPIIQVEDGKNAYDVLKLDSKIIGLPKNFKNQCTVTISAIGDLLQADGLELSKDILYENIADITFDKDISFANFESPITHQPLVKEVIGDKSAPLECCNHEQFDTLTQHKGKRFTVMNTSNNHIFDMGIEGLETTLDVFSKENILDVGTNRDPEDIGKGKVLVKNGIKIGFVAATFGLNGHQMPEEDSYRINTAKLLPKSGTPDLGLLKQQIDDCKAQDCDFIIASMHWGFEFEMFPRLKQIEATHVLVEYGADAIISHHPHVIQPVEYYRTNRDPNRVATIAYSLGSMTWGFTAPHLALSLVQNFSLTKGELEGETKTYIESSDITPVFRSAVDIEGKTETRIEKLNDHINGKSTRHSKEYIDQIKQYADLVLAQPK